jgi:peptidoglycan/xylan/chitin deacetylase (PgdA/CDA1 family)
VGKVGGDLTCLALSFDDGPSPWTTPILDLLRAHDARATFFLIGQRIDEHPDVVRRIVAEGHELGNHTFSHPWLARDCTDDAVHEELRHTNEAIARAAGERPRRFRAPHYDVDARVERIAAELDLTHTRGDITPPDWREGISAQVLATLILQQARPDAVIGLHDGIPPKGGGTGDATRQATVEAVRLVLPRLGERGHTITTASGILGGGK